MNNMLKYNIRNTESNEKFGKVEVVSVMVRETANDSGVPVTQLLKGDTFSITSTSGEWVKCKYGWVKSKSGETVYVTILTKDSNSDLYNDLVAKSEEVKDKPETDEESDKNGNHDYLEEYKNSTQSSDNSEGFLKNAKGIHGMPYQFDALADRRLGDSVFGRKYSEKIVTRIPLLMLTPGVPKFMGGYKKKDKANILTYMTGMHKDKDNGMMDLLLGEVDDGKFYSFEFAYKQYYACVNPILQRMARLLGIHDKTMPEKDNDVKLSKYRWEYFTNNAIKGIASSKEIIPFYIDSDSQISESFTNDTNPSMLAETVNGLSKMGNEMQFLLGGVAGVEFDTLQSENREDVLTDFNSFSEKYLKLFPQDLMKKLSSGFLTVASGGKMVFPEIWNDSSFSRSYNIELKLRTPDPDPFSWFINIGVPMVMMICMTAPRQLSGNSYQAPFLVRGFYKGFFNCDMGIITNMDIKKGDKGKWTTNGLPMVVDISFTLKDLYQIMSITSNEGMLDFLKNTALLDYVANMCGINVNKPDLLRTMDLYYDYFGSKVKDTLTFNNFLGVEQAFGNMMNSVFNNRI